MATTRINDMLRDGASAKAVLRAAGVSSAYALRLADEVGDNFGRFWSECPSPYLMLRVAERAQVPLWVQTHAVSRALQETVARTLEPRVANKLRDDLLSVADFMRANPGADFKGKLRCSAQWLTLSKERVVAQAVQSAAWIARASALQSCTCGEQHESEAIFALKESVDYTLSLLGSWGDSVVDPDDKPQTPDERAWYAEALGKLMCNEMRQVLDLETVTAAREWGPMRGAVGGVS